jgi:hypothetical protein
MKTHENIVLALIQGILESPASDLEQRLRIAELRSLVALIQAEAQTELLRKLRLGK